MSMSRTSIWQVRRNDQSTDARYSCSRERSVCPFRRLEGSRPAKHCLRAVSAHCPGYGGESPAGVTRIHAKRVGSAMNDDHATTLIGIKNYLIEHRRSLATQALVSTKQTGTRAVDLADALAKVQALVEAVSRALVDEKERGVGRN